jgi:hypothetical protein
VGLMVMLDSSAPIKAQVEHMNHAIVKACVEGAQMGDSHLSVGVNLYNLFTWAVEKAMVHPEEATNLWGVLEMAVEGLHER